MEALMRRSLPFLLSGAVGLSLGVGLALSGCGADPLPAGGSGVQGQPCEQEVDCETGNPCTHGFCFTGTCDVKPILDGAKPGAQQVAGDCLSINCAAGETVTEPDDDDAPEDDGADCMVPACEGGALTEIPAEAGESCASGVCDAGGVCSCAAPDPGAPQFVDPGQGTDDPMHGGAPGPCAYRTLTYALAQAQGSIRPAPGEYSVATGETLPFVLSGSQRLRCYDEESQTSATLSGSGTSTTGTATVVLSGVQNQLEGCIIAGGGADQCVVVTGDGSNGDGHELAFSDISGCDSGVVVSGAGNAVRLHDAAIHDNVTAGVSFSGGDKSGVIENNAFSANGTDITCTDPSPELSGGDNGGPSCTGCQNCPF
jgi:hypothetical protein